MSQNPYAPPSASFDNESQKSGRTEFGFRLGASLYWRTLILQSMVVIPVAPLMSSSTDLLVWKPTVMSLCAVLILAFSAMVSKPGVLFVFWGRRLNLPVATWRKFNWMVAGYYLLLGAVNAVFVSSASFEAWMTVKMFVPLLSLVAFCAAAPRFLRKVGDVA